MKQSKKLYYLLVIIVVTVGVVSGLLLDKKKTISNGIETARTTNAVAVNEKKLDIHDVYLKDAHKKTETNARGSVSNTNDKININSANYLDLRKSGLSSTLSKRIVYLRDAKGRIDSFSEVDAITGVGPKTLATIKEKLTIGASNSVGRPFKLSEMTEDKWYALGLSKKEYSSIEAFKKKHTKLYSLLAIRHLMSNSSYDMAKQCIAP